MKPLERLEQLAYIGRIEASPVVAHIAADFCVLRSGGGELDGGPIVLGGTKPEYEQTIFTN